LSIRVEPLARLGGWSLTKIVIPAEAGIQSTGPSSMHWIPARASLDRYEDDLTQLLITRILHLALHPPPLTLAFGPVLLFSGFQ